MTAIRKLYHFLGSVYFAIVLIASTALFVVAGTLIESLTDSHRYAAYFTYSNPLFVALLWGFFINILISSLRRWPFKPRHIPFLITHLGLLMILAGTLIKSSYGTQGTMGIMEGSYSDEIFIPDTYVVRVDKRGPENPVAYYPLNRKFGGHFNTELTADAVSSFADLKLNLAEYAPNSYERMETWVKGHWGVISGIKPFPVHDWSDPSQTKTLPVSTRVHLQPEQEHPWNIFAGRTSDIPALAKQAYMQNLEIELTDSMTHDVLYRGPIQSEILWDGSKASVDLDFSFSSVMGFDNPHVLVTVTLADRAPEIIRVPLHGEDSLKNINLLMPYLGRAPVAVDLHLIPALVFLEDNQGDLFLFAFDQNGRVYSEQFRHDNLHTLIAYDNGFGGYAVQARIPFAHSVSRQEQEKMQLTALKEQLRKGLQESPSLSPPLLMLRDACRRAKVYHAREGLVNFDSARQSQIEASRSDRRIPALCGQGEEEDRFGKVAASQNLPTLPAHGIDFPTCCIDFLTAWNNSSSWLFPADRSLPSNVSKAISELNWDEISDRERKACYLTNLLFAELEPHLNKGRNLLQVLAEKKWPLMDQLKALQPQSDFCSASMTAAILTLLTQQIFLIADQLPDQEDSTPLSEGMKARLLSAHLRAHGIHLSNITMPEPVIQEHFSIECPLTCCRHDDMPQNKLEDNIPKITLQVSDGVRTDRITLSYDRFGQGLKWPVLNGEYTVRFQPDFKEIPYQVRLRNARQINYANSMQPYSFESDIIITDKNSNSGIEKTISMNNVHETWEGYRFYLSNISPPDETAAKRIQLVVNWDPAKYWLTYPGAIVLSLGIALLFWFRRL